MLESIIILSIVAALVIGAIAKTIADKKKGVKCSGCPIVRHAPVRIYADDVIH